MTDILDPIQLFNAWFEEVKQADLPEPTAMVLATVSPEGQPSCRVVLLKAVDNRGFVFYTNLESRKGRELRANARGALCFYWTRVGSPAAATGARQVRVEGTVDEVSDAEADFYFGSRPRGAQIGAWASQQSAVLSSRAELEATVRLFEQKFAEGTVPRPPFWGGFRIVPQRIEFWASREDRLHDRMVFVREGDAWMKQLLCP